MSKRLLVLMCSIFLIVPLMFMGCGSGSDGSNGAPGAPGAPGEPGAPGATGATGPAGPITSTNESCMVCHTTGRVADISDAATTTVQHTHYNAGFNKPDVTITPTLLANVGGKPQVTFNIKKAGVNMDNATLVQANLRFYLATLVPKGTVTTEGTWASDLWEVWAVENPATTGGVWDNITDSANGNYTYTFANAFIDNAITLAPEFDNTQIQRVSIRYSAVAVTSQVAVGPGTRVGFGALDFNVPAVGGNTTGLGYLARQIVTVEACKQCHGPDLAGAAHNSYDTLLCVQCHTPIGNYEGAAMQEVQAYATIFFHKIHSAIAMPEWPTRIGGRGYGAVTYPQDVRNCTTCHTNSGRELGAGDETNNWRSNPSAVACGSCHVTAFAALNPTHTGGVQPDAACTYCHPAEGHLAVTLGASVTEAHDTSPTAVLHPTPKNVPEFDVTLTLDPVKSFYAAGDNVTVTATLKFHGTDTSVPTSLYLAPRGANGVADNILRVANLYVYGPRALPKPILGLGANGMTQYTYLFTGGTDARVLTDNTGFRYKVTIPTGLASGTYMVRARFADFGYVGTSEPFTDYKVESIAFQNIQIGSATVTKKVAGDICTDCHGTGTAPFHDQRHVVKWDTDECVSCHDYSGGHAAVLANRVHAVHAASVTGDMLNLYGATPDLDWSDVTYPLSSFSASNTPAGSPTWSSGSGATKATGGIGRCGICHASGNTSYRSVTHEVSCLGCHGDRTGATDHMLQSGGAYPALP